MKIPLPCFGLRCLVVLFVTAACVPLGAAERPRKLLVVTVTTGFRHASIPTAEKILAQLAQESGKFTVDFIHQPPGQPKKPAISRELKENPFAPAQRAALQKYVREDEEFAFANQKWIEAVAVSLRKLSPANLKAYDGVIFASTTGDLPLPDKQGFLNWIADGHAFIGLHSATDTFHGFPAYIEMIGGEFKTHGPQVAVDCLNQDPTHAAVQMLPSTWPVFDEIYQFKNFYRGKVRGLLTLDKHPNDKSPGDYPVAWCKQIGTGRMFYTSLGHRNDLWDPTAAEGGKRMNSPATAKLYQQHVLGGILWSLGLAVGDAKPQTVRHLGDGLPGAGEKKAPKF